MAELIWTDRALTELESIFDYIAADSRLYAQYTIQNILKTSEILHTFPESGRHLPEFPNLPHREPVAGKLPDNLSLCRPREFSEDRYRDSRKPAAEGSSATGIAGDACFGAPKQRGCGQ